MKSHSLRNKKNNVRNQAMLNVTLTDSDPVAHPHGSKEIVRYKTYPVLSPVSVHEGKEEKRWWCCFRVSLTE